jgi:hypothetical protein
VQKWRLLERLLRTTLQMAELVTVRLASRDSSGISLPVRRSFEQKFLLLGMQTQGNFLQLLVLVQLAAITEEQAVVGKVYYKNSLAPLAPELLCPRA